MPISLFNQLVALGVGVPLVDRRLAEHANNKVADDSNVERPAAPAAEDPILTTPEASGQS